MFANGVDALKIQGRPGSMNFLAVFSLIEQKSPPKKAAFNIKHKSSEREYDSHQYNENNV